MRKRTDSINRARSTRDLKGFRSKSKRRPGYAAERLAGALRSGFGFYFLPPAVRSFCSCLPFTSDLFRFPVIFRKFGCSRRFCEREFSNAVRKHKERNNELFIFLSLAVFTSLNSQNVQAEGKNLSFSFFVPSFFLCFESF